MKKWIKIIIMIFCIIIFASGSILGVVKLLEYNEAKKEGRKAAQAKMEQEKIQMAYWKLNYSFGLAHYIEIDLEHNGVYQPFPTPSEDYNKFGIDYYIYLLLKMYESCTGTTLTYETVVDYFSKKFEPDESLRLYNNGLHPEIAAYVEWAQGRRDEMKEYINKLMGLYGGYCIRNRDIGFKDQLFSALSPQMYDELAKKEADPSYELDLLSLQKQGF